MQEDYQINNEEIEGIGEDEDASWGDYPIDTLLIRHETRTVHDVIRRIQKGSFIMDPEFQRDFIWTDEKQSKLIESVLMRLPLPVFYLAEDEKGKMIVVDGLQRLSTFQRFVNNDLSLKLPDQKELDRKKFNMLSPKLQNRLEDCNLILYVIDAKVPERARLDIFERVNSGVPLTRQQMRNSLYTGAGTRFLKNESSIEVFKIATGGSLKSSTMRDREFINRFCSFQILPLSAYKGDMDEFLAIGLKQMNKLSELELEKISSDFRRSMINNYFVFGKHAFRKFNKFKSQKSVLNASIWDVMSTGLSNYQESLVESKAEILKDYFERLMYNEDFLRSITYGTNDLVRVKARFDLASKMFDEVFGS